MLLDLIKAWNSLNMDWDPLSLTDCSGVPKFVNRLLNTSMVLKDVVDFVGMTLHWVSTITVTDQHSQCDRIAMAMRPFSMDLRGPMTVRWQ